MELGGRVAVVTGASSGIGRTTALTLDQAGCTVVAVARRAERLDGLAGVGARIHPHPADVTHAGAVEGLVSRVEREFGALHVLVNNAGRRSHSRFRGLEDLDDLASILDLNLVAAARCTAAFAPLLEASAPSRVVNVASVAGKVGLGSPAYSASKFGLVGFSEALRAEWDRRGIAVSVVNPGFTQTEGFPQDRFLAVPGVRRLVATPEDVADAIVAVVRSGARERTVPRWYRALVVLRHVAAPVVWAAAGRMGMRRGA